ncbi:MAG TPA: restriction endonuclease [Ureibacillus sp.]|nr:restriction endonuclease [Ureibacillus sp.]
MGRKSGTKRRSRNTHANSTSSFLPVFFLIIMGMVVADEINPFYDDITTTIVFLLFLIAINIGPFHFMGLHKAFKRTPRIRYWKIKQKAYFFLYVLIIFIMICKILIHLDFIGFLFVLGSFFVVIGLLMKRNNKFYTILLLFLNKREKLEHIGISEVDKMTGTEFELFLAKLYDALGYYSEVTPNTDYGIDVLTIKDKIKTGIQAKCYGEGHSVGVKAINEVCGGGGVYNVHKKIVITNRYFTKQASFSAKANNIELIDRDALQRLIMEYHQAIEKKANFSFFPFLNRWKQG